MGMAGLELGEVAMGTATQAGESGARDKVVQGLGLKYKQRVHVIKSMRSKLILLPWLM